MEDSPAFPQKVNRVAMGPIRPTARPVPKRVDNIGLNKGLHTNSRTAQMTVKQNGQTGHGVSLSPENMVLSERSQTEKPICMIRCG